MTGKRAKEPDMRWDAKIGPASIIGVVQLIAMIAGLGALYGTLSGKLDAAATNAIEAKTAVSNTAKEAQHRDEKVAAQNERIGKIETSVSFIVPAIQRIEAKLDAK